MLLTYPLAQALSKSCFVIAVTLSNTGWAMIIALMAFALSVMWKMHKK
jgi:hypothetical protein